MSKKKIFEKHLEKGRFYLHSDRQGGHPALLYKKNDNKNQYLILLFTSSPGPKRRKLKESIEPSRAKESFVHNLPTIAKRRDLGKNRLENVHISKEDKPILKLIKNKKQFTETNKRSQQANRYNYSSKKKIGCQQRSRKK